jgi:succinate dehydrogenase/fumarate reductase flavoprotein subunit
MKKNLDRRTFLTGAGILAAAGLAGAVAGCSPSANTDNNASGGGTPSGGGTLTAADGIGSGNQPYPWDATPPTIAEADIEETLDCDVLVAGTGVSGACAIRIAAEEGAKVIYCDKQAAVSSSSGDIAIFGRNNNSVQANWGRVNAYDWDMIVDHEMDEGSYFPKRLIWSKWAMNNGDVFQWYISSFPEYVVAKDEAEGMTMMGGMDGGGTPGWIKPNFYPAPTGYDAIKVVAEGGHPCFLTSLRCDQLTFNQKCVEIADGKGAQGFFESALAQLIKEGDRITGGYIYNYATKKYKKVNASKGVILCTGDYAGNKDMEAYFLPDVYRNNNPSMGGGTDPDGAPMYSGDHLKLGDWVGAKIQQHHAPMIHHMGNMGGFGASNAQSMGIAPYLRLNKLGKRFMNEDCPGQQTENQIEIQPGQMCYMLWDANWPDKVSGFPPMHGSFITPTVTGPDAFNELIESGAVKKGETIEDLLDQLGPSDENWVGIDKAVALESIRRYQELCKAGKDEDFNKASNILTSFETGPFYATYFTKASNLCNMGGLSSDEDCHTFDEDGNVLKGLYVAGNSQGDRFTVQYPIALEGAASSLAMYYGYVAGQNCARGV